MRELLFIILFLQSFVLFSKECDLLLSNQSSLPEIESTDQCYWGSCWVVSTIHQAEHLLKEKHGLNIKLSDSYTYLMHIRAQLRSILKEGRYNKLDNGLFLEGAPAYMARFYIQKYGVVPKKVMIKNDSFKNEAVKNEIIKELQEIVDEFISLSRENQKKQMDEYYHQLESVLDKYLGPVPETFEVKGKTYTPKSFYQNFLNSEKSARVIIYDEINDSSTFIPLNLREIGESFKVNKLDRGTYYLLKRVKKEIDEKRSVLLSYGNLTKEKRIADGGITLDHKNGLLTSKRSMRDDDLASGHGVLIVGYVLNEQKKITHLKILNTYGPNEGQNGYYYMDVHFFHRFAQMISLWK